MKWTLILFALLLIQTAWAIDADDPTPTEEIGAEVFSARCVLCHGNKGLGEGIMPMRISEYPKTSLVPGRHALDKGSILKTTVYGGLIESVSSYMPPFGKELSWTELESVTKFIMLLRTDNEKAYAMLEKINGKKDINIRLGQQIFSTRCVLCHGKYGQGDGRMSRILKDPPPANLTASRIPHGYTKDIIKKGGEAMGRSKHMPPWGDQLTDSEIDSLLLYVFSIRD